MTHDTVHPELDKQARAILAPDKSFLQSSKYTNAILKGPTQIKQTIPANITRPVSQDRAAARRVS